MLQLLRTRSRWLDQQQHTCTPSRQVAAAAAAKKQQKPKRRKPKQPLSQRITYVEEEYLDDLDDEPQGSSNGPADIRLAPGTRIPKAPAPKAAAAADAALSPEELYPVFPKQPKPVERLQGGKWSWEDDTAAAAAAQQQPPARLWNPRSGFMRTRAEVEQEQAAAAGAAASGTGQSSATSSSAAVERLPDRPNPLQPPQLPRSAAAAAAVAVDAAAAETPEGQLPVAGRGEVLTKCVVTAGAMTAAAGGLSLLAAQQSAALFGSSQEAIDKLLQVPAGLQDLQQAGVMLGAAAAVTAARFVLKQQWQEFREASDCSNRQVLSNLGWPDVALVALLSGASEELLFRWALITATWPDAKGVLLSGAVFGVLHISGGRNAAFAAWSTAVGCLYGAAFLATGNVWVPAGAHALANFAAAAVWKSSSSSSNSTQSS